MESKLCKAYRLDEFLSLLRAASKKRGPLNFHISIYFKTKNINIFLDNMGKDHINWIPGQTTDYLSESEWEMLTKYLPFYE